MKKFKHTNDELEQARLEAKGGDDPTVRQGQKKSKYGQSIIEF